ncbi:restriction endonuclease subunit S [Kitasatospora sp. NPDC001540]|uniref:restriction endonuclease subunit S n=1 Tax=Kitasatospora sp. NPDC001540 TaxID=3364014 RepID=UPI0036834507
MSGQKSETGGTGQWSGRSREGERAEWAETTIGEVATVFDGPHATPKKTDTGPWFLSISSLEKGRLNLAESAHLSEEDFATWTRRVTPREGDVLFSYETRLGEAALMPAGVRAALGRRMGILRPKEGVVEPQFLLYAYLGPEFQETIAARTIHGATVDRIPLVSLHTWPIRLPRLSEQRAIVSVLGALDEKIAANERITATAEDLAALLVSGEPERGRVRMEDICVLHKEQVAPQEIVDAVVDHYSLPAFDTGKLPERVSPGSIKSGKFTVSEPAVLLSKLNPEIPRVWNVEPDPDVPSLASTEFLVLVPKGSLTVHELWAVTSQRGFRESLAAKVTGTSKSHQRVRPAEVMAMEVVDPRQFGGAGQKIKDLASRAALARQESKALAVLRDTLLPQLMSGRLRVRDAEKIVEDQV